MSTRRILALALLGAGLGLLVAEFFPSLGQRGLAKNLHDLGLALGAHKPYTKDALIGAGIGALLGLLSGKRY
jgi:hypothetical protein